MIPTLQQRYDTLTNLLSDKNKELAEKDAEIERLNKRIVTLQNHCLGAADLAWWKDDAKKLIGELADALEPFALSKRCPEGNQLIQRAREATK